MPWRRFIAGKADASSSSRALSTHMFLNCAHIVLRSLPEVTLDGVDGDAPLRPAVHEAERLELGLDLGTETKAHLRVILYLLTGARAGRRPPKRPPVMVRSVSSDHWEGGFLAWTSTENDRRP